MIHFINSIWKMFSSFIALLFISCLPYLFDGFSLNLNYYITEIIVLVKKLGSLGELEFMTSRTVSRALFPTILEPWQNSLVLVGGSLIISVLTALIISVFIINLPSKRVEGFQQLFTYIQSVPDIFYIIGLQIFMVWLYQKTNIVFLNFASFGQEQAIFLPILSLSITPSMILTKVFLSQMQDELSKNYAHFAKAKGLKSTYVILTHILRNTIYSLFHYSKTIILFMLTNLLIVEYLFNINGMMSFILDYPYPEVFFVSILLLYYPIFFLFQLYELIVPSVIKRSEA